MNALIDAAADLQSVCDVNGWPLRTCSAEDLLVLKAFADRPKDWVPSAYVRAAHDAAVVRQAR